MVARLRPSWPGATKRRLRRGPNRCCSCFCSAGPAISTPSIQSPRRRPSFAATSARSAPRSAACKFASTCPKLPVDDSLRMPSGMTVSRLASKRSLLAELNRQQLGLAAALETMPYENSQRDAFDVLTSGRLAQALAIEDESDAVRDRYGRHMF